ncbi:MAG: class I SAM-dependent methyltransferase [bacterium]|nr:class I SAM-dependent methyltransferase [bacterium]
MSPANAQQAQHLHRLPPGDRLKHAGAGQRHWYEFLAGQIAGTVLDVGSGTGYGLDILRRGPGVTSVMGIDIAPVSLRVSPCTVDDIASDGYDWAIALDVIEHAEDDRAFLSSLLRIARKGVAITTPNYLISRCANPYHLREYTPDELSALLDSMDYRTWSSNAALAISPHATLQAASAEANFCVVINAG